VALTGRQIERYSRQLIVPKFGGVAQERLLASRIVMIANRVDVDSVLAYLVGAGVRQIDLTTNFDSVIGGALAARMHDLNPDSAVRVGPELDDGGGFDLALVLASDDETVNQARLLFDRGARVGRNFTSNFSIVFARLAQPARIAVIAQPPPCPRCASVADLFGAMGERAENASFIAMLAAVETIKLLSRYTLAPKPILIEFRGYESSARIIDMAPECCCNETCAVK
jgi:hypothetical protein